MIAKPATPEAVELLHKGAIALAAVERVGIRVDEAYLDATLEQVGGQIKALEAELKQDEVWTVWRKRYREANLDSLSQLTEVLFSPKLLGHPYPEGAEFRTATGRYRADESVLATVDLPFVQAYLRKRKLDKLHGTYLKGIKREAVDGFLHNFFNLNTARTYRSCVAEGEKVRTTNGHTPIEQVRVGDQVLSRHPEYPICVDLKRVTWAGCTGRREVTRLTVVSPFGERREVLLTPEHRVRLVGVDYRPAEDLRPGDLLARSWQVESVQLTGKVLPVYDLEVEDFGNFHVNGVCVHNSSSDVNFQNVPIRNPEIGKLVRSAFRARPGRRLVENDFGGIEVKVAACYNKDPALIRYVTDPSTDMHRDTAMELFCLTKEQVDKRTTRDWAKNRFVFPQFYGSVYFQCTPHLWEGVMSGAAQVGGVSLRKHLREHGITTLGACQPKQDPRPGTFEAHVRKVERSFWDDRFRVYSEWKRSWYAQYLERGWLRMHTGFVCEGVFGRNDVINYPVQGSAFHCLLACLIEMVLVRLRWLKMRARVVGQIHDCVLADVPDNEVQGYLDLVTEVMTEWLPKQWPWIIVPLTAEAEVTPVSGTWHKKEQWVKTNGTWGPKG